MALRHSPKIVSDGLVFCIDPSNIKSYSGTGNTVVDACRNIGSITKSAGLAFAGSGSQKYFDYDYGEQDRIEVPNNSVLNYDYADWSYNLWINRESADQSGWQQLFIKGLGTERRPGVWFYNNDTTALHITWRGGDATSQISINKTDFDVPIGEWCNIVIQARDASLQAFLNGVKDTQAMSLTSYNYGANNQELYIGSESATYGAPNMRLGYFSVYNTSLTNDQIVENYNALKGRFGL